MPLYYLDVRDGGELIADIEGEEHPSLDGAQASALAGARELLAGSLRRGRSYRETSRQFIEIRVGTSVVCVVPVGG